MKNWIWMHLRADETPEDWKRQLAQCRQCGLDAVLPLVYTGAQALYGSRHLPVAAAQLERLLPLAAAAGLEVHAWIVALRCNAAPVQREHPDWYSISRRGASSLEEPPYIPSYQWLCPSRPEVRAFVRRTVSELAGYEGLAGVHLDYIRHPDVILPQALQPRYGLVQDGEFPEYDFCYCAFCRQAFRRRHGRDPLHVEDAAADVDWRRFRWQSVAGVVEEAATAAREGGKALTAAVFATPELARTYVRQDWPQWPLDGGVLPMVYHYYYDQPVSWIGRAVREGVGELQGARPLYAGLFVPQLDARQLAAGVEGALQEGADGISIFSYRAMREEHWPALRQALGA